MSVKQNLSLSSYSLGNTCWNSDHLLLLRLQPSKGATLRFVSTSLEGIVILIRRENSSNLSVLGTVMSIVCGSILRWNSFALLIVLVEVTSVGQASTSLENLSMKI